MKERQIKLSERLRRLGFINVNQMRLYGKVFELRSEPIVMSDNLVLVDATEVKSGESRRVRVPLPIVTWQVPRNYRHQAWLLKKSRFA